MPVKIRIIYIVALLIYIVVLLGMRYRVGVDTISYMNAYKHAKTLEHFFSTDFINERYEFGYLLLCAICKSITKEFWLLQTVIALITNCLVFIFLYQNCRNVFLGILFFFLLQWFYFSMEILREGMAIAIFLVNYKNYKEQRWLIYYLVSLLSISLHYSAIIIWFFPFAKLLKPNLFFFILCFLFILISPLVEQLNEYMTIAAISGRIDQYTDADTFNLNWKILELVRTALPAIALVYIYRKYKIEYNEEPMLLLQILFCMGAFAIPLIFSRFANYTCMFVVVALSNILSSEKVKNLLKIILVCFILLTQAYTFYTRLSRWIPYISILDPRQVREREQIWKRDFIFGY